MEKNYLLLLSCIVLISLVVRYCVSLNSYSGANTPPIFGDYEAQRHWMEITYHLNITDWYQQTKDNDLMYWGLDYPPLTAYHSKICGYIANLINPDWVALKSSRGHESYQHKLFMRNSVMFVDVLIYIPAVIFYFATVLNKVSKVNQLCISCFVLLYPGLILVDHGHFQYNCVSLGLMLLAVISFIKNAHLIGSICFVFALNYKQMELYHSLPVFFYLLGVCYNQKSWFQSFVKLASIGITVIFSFILCWLPFLRSAESALQVLRRLFPLNRGLYEDKVANFWCALSAVIKIKHILKQEHIVWLCITTTLLVCLPSCINLFVCASKKKFLFALVNCSLAFFLFSYQVHEKSILIVALPVCLVFPYTPVASVWFLAVSTVSMYPLLFRDGQAVSYFALLAIFLVASMFIVDLKSHSKWLKLCIGFSLFVNISVHILHATVKPPERLPDIFPLLFAVNSCVHFLLFLIYFNYMQIICNDDNKLCNLYVCHESKERKLK
ncbi:dolichyl pyrophosphate Man9GlcNAc2 alpha-1,3-glucosyltransferase-like [Hydractinia symbiolongicarpus]|uniref:dolichyl pyrophosphate Man9GlcNAc2 alpha-1,3-glucosyltransferase-like n=1 Tax=Hydractinia symbiolongicarpus TaxID=13093 RepID=UPI00254CD872|nr:dolichyl pyrophosphate Man9GlcNAc2 alpha-1,3-glucosyltransferase-like [Hydractinia symbiolongicarpus]